MIWNYPIMNSVNKIKTVCISHNKIIVCWKHFNLEPCWRNAASIRSESTAWCSNIKNFLIRPKASDPSVCIARCTIIIHLEKYTATLNLYRTVALRRTYPSYDVLLVRFISQESFKIHTQISQTHFCMSSILAAAILSCVPNK